MRSRNEEATHRKAFHVWGDDTLVLSAVPEHQRYSKQNTGLADSIDTNILQLLHWQDQFEHRSGRMLQDRLEHRGTHNCEYK